METWGRYVNKTFIYFSFNYVFCHKVSAKNLKGHSENHFSSPILISSHPVLSHSSWGYTIISFYQRWYSFVHLFNIFHWGPAMCWSTTLSSGGTSMKAKVSSSFSKARQWENLKKRKYSLYWGSWKLQLHFFGFMFKITLPSTSILTDKLVRKRQK